jgi:hypothetical protein
VAIDHPQPDGRPGREPEPPAGNDNGLFNDIGSTGGGHGLAVVDDEGAIPLGLYTVLSGMHLQPELAYRLSWFDGEVPAMDPTFAMTPQQRRHAQRWSITVCEPAELPVPAGYAGTVYTSDFKWRGRLHALRDCRRVGAGSAELHPDYDLQ